VKLEVSFWKSDLLHVARELEAQMAKLDQLVVGEARQQALDRKSVV